MSPLKQELFILRKNINIVKVEWTPKWQLLQASIKSMLFLKELVTLGIYRVYTKQSV
jgi:hypothetical protein